MAAMTQDKPATRTRAIDFAKGVIRRSSDWQEVQSALFDHAEFGPWLTAQDSDGMAVIRAAESSFRGNLPSGYSD